VANATGCCCCCCCCSYYSSILTTHCLLPPPLNTSHDLLYLGYRQPLAPLHNSSARSSQRERPTYLQHSTAQHSTAPYLAQLQGRRPHYSTTGHCHTTVLPPVRPARPTNQPAPSVLSLELSLDLAASLPSPRPTRLTTSARACPCARVLAYKLRLRVCVCGSGTLHFSCCYCCYSTAACCRCYHRAAAAAHPPQLLSEPCRRELPFRPPSLSPM
jgi:hypothetical protein